ncbi:MAG: glucosaminidase domain-containing protein, partial [Bacteroidota bacterium]
VSFCHKGDRNANGTVACKGEVAVGKSKEGARKSKTMMPSVMIMDRGVRAPERLVSFMLINNRGLDSLYVARLVKTYIIECRIEGVNHDVAFCQMCLETGFLRFTGSVSRYQNNFCGLGAINAYTAGDWFGSLEEGVRAHIQHLKAYASVDRIVSPVVDHRFGRVQRGTVFTIYDLSGTWAADPEYGSKIDYLLQKLYQH